MSRISQESTASSVKQDTEISLKVKLLVVVFAISLAPFSLDIGIIPVTLQTLMLFTTAVILSPIEALSFGFIYLLLGALGFPVFAEFSSGFEKLIGPTAGFLWAFPIICLFISWDVRKRTSSFLRLISSFLKAHVLLLIPGFGILFLALPEADLLNILISLLPGLVIKSILGPVLVIGIKRLFTSKYFR